MRRSKRLHITASFPPVFLTASPLTHGNNLAEDRPRSLSVLGQQRSHTRPTGDFSWFRHGGHPAAINGATKAQRANIA